MASPHHESEQPFRFPEARVVAPGAPWTWLARAWDDLRWAPGASLFYGAAFAAMGWLMSLAVGRGEYLLALTTGFLLMAPFLAVGLYDLSRRRERGEAPRLAPTLTAWRGNAPALGLYAVILALLLAAWIRVSVVVVALFFTGGMPDLGHLPRELLGNPEGLVFVAAYLAAGLGFALLVFATSVVSIPMLLDRDKMDALSAMIASFNAVRLNRGVMVLWATAIVAITGLGMALYFFGLVLAMPLVGHATWHAYRDAVVSEQ
ncbi:MAG TPA: DUF2189 domain-containing protein [Burkholderiales bacterium]|nr:DUF2189 domain-containing protein [Burkholderiales bacterium]